MALLTPTHPAPTGAVALRIIHLSDVHVWRCTRSTRSAWRTSSPSGCSNWSCARAKNFRLERLRDVVERILSLKADHLLISGDLTTTALPEEFQDARKALAELLVDSDRVTVLPGNHDRYTFGSVRHRAFEEWFGAFSPPMPYPWLRYLDDETAILGLDATRSHISATGRLPDVNSPPRSPARRPRDPSPPTDRRLSLPAGRPPVYARELPPSG